MSRLVGFKLTRAIIVSLLVCVLLGSFHVGESYAAGQVSLESDGVQQVQSVAHNWPDEVYSELFTNEMAEEIAVWILDAYPDLPFSDPTVEIHEDGIVCRGIVEILGVEVAASGRVSLFLEGGEINGKIEEISFAGIQMPGLLMNKIDDVRSLYDEITWDVEVTNLELREGELLLEGVYKDNVGGN